MHPATRQHLYDLFSTYGHVQSIQPLNAPGDGKSLVLITMATPEAALAAQHALGLTSFGFSSLIVDPAHLHLAPSQ